MFHYSVQKGQASGNRAVSFLFFFFLMDEFHRTHPFPRTNDQEGAILVQQRGRLARTQALPGHLEDELSSAQAGH